MSEKQQDVLAVIELYKMRGEAKMREARKWFMTEFNPQSAAEIAQMLLSGEEESANYRMITSHWNMACSFVNNGGIDEKIFLDSNSEHIVVYAKMRPFLNEIREMFGEPTYLLHIETLVLKVPNVETILENRQRLFERWAKKKE
jgi:hypothetical protein